MWRNVQIQSVLFVAALLGLGASSSLAVFDIELPGPQEVQVDHRVFVGEIEGAPAYQDEDLAPLPVTIVPAGSAVRFFWNGDMTHTVTSGIAGPTGPDNEFDSGERHAANEPENGGSLQPFIVTFDEAGVYKYFCQIHLTQHGVVIVT